MAQYTIKTILLDESRFGKIHNSLKLYFPNSELKGRGNTLTIRVDLPEYQSVRDASFHLNEYFGEKHENGIIADYAVMEE